MGKGGYKQNHEQAVAPVLGKGAGQRKALGALAAGALLLSACAGPTVQVRPLFPPPADLAVEPKPVPPADIVTSAQAAAQYDVAIEGWGERGWRAVARICRWAREQGAEGLACPDPTP